VKLAESGEVKVTTTKTQEVTFAVHNDPHTTPEEELVSKCQFPVRRRE